MSKIPCGFVLFMFNDFCFINEILFNEIGPRSRYQVSEMLWGRRSLHDLETPVVHKQQVSLESSVSNYDPI